jgi:Rhs element Vgr protein
MTDDRQIPTARPTDLPTFTILSDGSEINAEYQVQAIVVDRSYNRVASADIVILDGDPAQEDFKVSDSEDFVPGRSIEIQAGYHGDNEVIFKGIVVRHGLRVHNARPSMLRVECKDEAVKLAAARKTAYFYDSTDAEIIEEIAADVGLGSDVDPTPVTHRSMVQFYATDWDFIVTRAEANGSLVVTDDGTLTVKPPAPSGEPALSLRYGGNIIGFEVVMDALEQVKSVRASTWDPADQEILEVDASGGAVVSPGNVSSDDLAAVMNVDPLDLRHAGFLGTEELQSWADALRTRRDFAKVRGRVRIQGYAHIGPGETVELAGVGDRFTGRALVSGVHHEINVENWLTDITLGLTPQWFGSATQHVVAAEANGLLPGASSLQVGQVTALEGDPDAEERIQVRIPLIAESGEGVWARIATLDAGENRGSFFRPEIGDEVVVGFVSDDPRRPVVLGMLNSSARPAPLIASDDNPEKGFITRSDMRLIFDDEKATVQILTSNGNSITLSDEDGAITIEDENQNKLVLDSNGVTIESGADIVISAVGDVTIEGKNVAASATAQLKVEGSAGAELSSSVSTVVKGATVMIN